MRILAILAHDARRHLQHAVAPAYQLLPDHGLAASLATLKSRGCDALVLDPAILDDDAYGRVLAAIAATSLPVVIYTPLTAAGARRVLQIEEFGPRELILRGVDDDLELIRQKIASLMAPSVTSVLFSGAATRFRRFPESLQTASVRLFGGGPLPRWVDEFAESAQLGRRSIDRWMLRSGLSGASTLLDVARLARTWEPLAERKERPADVASSHGYSRLRLLVSHSRRLVGVVPAELGRSISRDEFTGRLSRALLRR
ncbi:MAG: hypothetical protein HY084_05140 [Gemmatimonadetes bacterium]|nr:hypothetical protein [Gemmatimonadota bacterium]